MNHFINGPRIAGHRGRAHAVYNPATGQQSGSVDFASPDEVHEAVLAAQAAFPKFADTTPATSRSTAFYGALRTG